MRAFGVTRSFLILEILRGSAVCISGRSQCGVGTRIVMRKSARRNEVKTCFVLHLGRPWLGLGFSSWDDSNHCRGKQHRIRMVNTGI
jgi:hypothetical protein